MEIREQVEELLASKPEEVQQIVSEILGIENRYLHMTLPRGIHDEIVAKVEQIVK